jgi:tetraacyldisaccharide 4'-kinase
MKYLRWLLLPFSLLYGLVVIIRNWCYDARIFKSRRFNKPVIAVGNLDVGGAGKTPMTEYLVRLLKDDYKLATLSRGYGRETKGFIEIKSQESGVGSRESGVGSRESGVGSRESGVGSQEARDKNQSQDGITTVLPVPIVPTVPGVPPVTPVPGVPRVPGVPLFSNGTPGAASRIGDEPAQFSHKFPEITVAVCEKRVDGINKLLPEHDVILLDDAFQHRAVRAGLSILLFDYNRLDEPHLLLPAGNLREPFSGRWRAQIIVVTKCPPNLTVDERNDVYHKIGPLPYQPLFFTAIAYQHLQPFSQTDADVKIDAGTTVFLLTGIANAAPIVQHLNRSTPHVIHHKYPDHHRFTPKNIAKLAEEFGACPSRKKIIVTTEKDAMRLEELWFNTAQYDAWKSALYILPIWVEFLDSDGPRFDELITDYVRTNTTNSSIH